MSDRPDTLIVRMLRWIDSGLTRVMERVGHTEQQAVLSQVALKQIQGTLERIEARIEQIEQRLAPPAAPAPMQPTSDYRDGGSAH